MESKRVNAQQLQRIVFPEGFCSQLIFLVACPIPEQVLGLLLLVLEDKLLTNV